MFALRHVRRERLPRLVRARGRVGMHARELRCLGEEGAQAVEALLERLELPAEHGAVSRELERHVRSQLRRRGRDAVAQRRWPQQRRDALALGRGVLVLGAVTHAGHRLDVVVVFVANTFLVHLLRGRVAAARPARVDVPALLLAQRAQLAILAAQPCELVLRVDARSGHFGASKRLCQGSAACKGAGHATLLNSC